MAKASFAVCNPKDGWLHSGKAKAAAVPIGLIYLLSWKKNDQIAFRRPSKSSPDGGRFCREALFACSPAVRRAAKSVRKALLHKARPVEENGKSVRGHKHRYAGSQEKHDDSRLRGSAPRQAPEASGLSVGTTAIGGSDRLKNPTPKTAHKTAGILCLSE